MTEPADPDEAITDETLDIFDVYADLGGVAEVAENLGVKIHRVRRWIERRESTRCPEPIKLLVMGHLYSMRDWRAWFALWRITRGSETWLRGKNTDQDIHPGEY